MHAHPRRMPSHRFGLIVSGSLILAELAPGRANDIDLRVHDFADSRGICGAHNYSAIGAGAINAATIVAALHASPVFRGYVDSTRRELASYRQSSAPMDGSDAWWSER